MAAVRVRGSLGNLAAIRLGRRLRLRRGCNEERRVRFPTVHKQLVERTEFGGLVVGQIVAPDHRAAGPVGDHDVGPRYQLSAAAEVCGGVGAEFGVRVFKADVSVQLDLIVRFEYHRGIGADACAVVTPVVHAPRCVMPVFGRTETCGVALAVGVAAHADQPAIGLLPIRVRRRDQRGHQGGPDCPAGAGSNRP